ncbi:MAG: hypothetical protein DIAAKJNI_00394 [Candidatus Argoarchaeum ethanivorans]|uniref:Uncharacterized protein n=1 Tax=Candidatus Argoarchaeum ethanivorans TaxID=2608793 RepID=A0A811T6D9_9EURY|nr:MAG: hypothetical protein DIAAKJNI_00394 [Candidatus Argoarchaeum ethanivorans]
MDALVKHKEKLEEVDNVLLDAISHRTNLNKNEIKTLDMEEIEKKLKIRAKPPKIHFEWELAEKMGWQLTQTKFTSEEELNRREKMVDTLIITK